MNTVSDIDDATLLQEKYRLNPKAHLIADYYYDNNCGYATLLAESRIRFSQENLEQNPSDTVDHALFLPAAIEQSSIDDIGENFSCDEKRILDKNTAISVIKKIITPEIDAQLKSYFKSNYAVLWFNWAVISGPDTNETTAYKWHCDTAPTTHLKTITYFDNTSDHGSSTCIGDLAATQKLKEIGYLLNEVKTRQVDISDLLHHFDVNLKVESFDFKAGDTVLFNPNKRMHQIIPPNAGCKRHCLTLCYLPSPVPWDVLIQNGFNLTQGGLPFEHASQQILDISNRLKYQSHNNNQQHSFNKINQSDVIDLDPKGRIKTPASLKHHLKQMFDNEAYVERIYTALLSSTSALNFSIDELLVKLKQSFHKEIQWDGIFNLEDQRNLSSLLEFEKRYVDSCLRYASKGKPKPKAIMWPDPTHAKYPQSRLDAEPYVISPKIMTMDTPVSSCGSCFAFEISRVMQEQGFNYLIEERPDNPDLGVFVDGYNAGDEYVNFSANYGILFNTPTLLQLAQRAFGLKRFEKYCILMEDGKYMDPYRENVFFASKAAYLNDYPKHTDALRKTLENVKVMIFTAGLNECWAMQDGTVISRNPRTGFHHLLQHKVLSVQENVDSIKEFVKIVRQFNPEFQLVISLSPVPLLATGRGDTHHILEANTHSKSVLRVAIDQVVAQLDGVYYLPSYELVKECSAAPWTEDDRHVTRETVMRVVNMFKNMFVVSGVEP